MKSNSIILSLTVLFFLIACKSEEEKNEVVPKQGETYVLPPKAETQEQSLEKQENIDPRVAAEIIAVIKENLAATQAEDKERVLKTIHKDCPQMRSTKQGMDYVFANFDMIYNLEQADVLEISEEEAKVYYRQTTRAASGAGFQSTRATGIHIMKKENGSWKIFKTEYLTSEPIM